MIIRSEEIYKKANSIVKSCGTRDTLKIAREPGIHLHFLDNLNDLLGMYTYRHKERHILLNSNMEYLIIRAVRDDLAEMPEYTHCETAAYAPEPIQEHRRVRRYQYEMMGVVYLANAAFQAGDPFETVAFQIPRTNRSRLWRIFQKLP